MAGSDPLGRRALFWLAPTDHRPEEGNAKTAKHSSQEIDEGRKAFYSKAGSRVPSGKSNSKGGVGGRAGRGRSVRYGTGGISTSHAGLLRQADADIVVGGIKSSGITGNGVDLKNQFVGKVKNSGNAQNSRKAEDCPYGVLCVDITCGSCKKTATVTMQEFIMMHWPVWLWLPGRGNTHLLTCPMCRKRTWLSVSWPSSRKR